MNLQDLSSGRLDELEGVTCLRGSYLIETILPEQEVKSFRFGFGGLE